WQDCDSSCMNAGTRQLLPGQSADGWMTEQVMFTEGRKKTKMAKNPFLPVEQTANTQRCPPFN
uniref:Uncharacterized protein n=1 Tax=Sphaeramia orbicularis TaxID=375764 RepID=A0A673C1E7_9TELE